VGRRFESSRAHSYIPRMPRRVAGRPALRAIALVTAVSLTATSGALPMCLSALAQAVAQCAMHHEAHHPGDHTPASSSPQLVSPHTGQPCHPDAGRTGCAAGSACPAAGPAMVAAAEIPVAVRNVSRVAAPASPASLLSYLAPPLAPPPQA